MALVAASGSFSQDARRIFARPGKRGLLRKPMA
jgi:hypothetical protein